MLVGVGCQELPTVRSARVERNTVEATVASVNSGTVRAEKLAELAFGAVGRVRKLNVSLGDRVKAGTVLAEIENSDLQVALETAERELKRREQLYLSHALSQSEVDDARRLRELTLVNYQKSLITAPYDGIITEVNVEIGQLSQITAVIPKALLRIVDLQPRYITAEIDEVDLPKVIKGLRARVKILAARREPFKAVIRRVVPFVSSIREQDRTSEVELDVDSEGNLLPAGASADVEIIVDTHTNVLTVPARAILGRAQDHYVYRLSGANAEKVKVTLGLFNYDRAEIVAGLAEGDTVILADEGIELTDGVRVKVKP